MRSILLRHLLHHCLVARGSELDSIILARLGVVLGRVGGGGGGCWVGGSLGVEAAACSQ